ncbi:MAG TPA: CBS domain-containing protein [Acetobacteraceae bacterium]|nr:CBS domain-containing protein [Acetobacteraceae bacterium]
MRAADVMTKTVTTIRSDATLGEAIAAMVGGHVSGLPVTDPNGKIVGVVTEGDLLRRAETDTAPHRPAWIEFLRGPNKTARDYVLTHSRRVDDLMTPNVISVDEDTDLGGIVTLMETKHIKRVLVMRGDALMGIVSRTDIVRAVAQAIAEEATAPLSDAAITERLEQEIRERNLGTAESVGITVKDGIVKLEGVIFNDGLRPALRVAAQNIPGVKAVEDHLTWVEPVTGMSLAAH